MTKDTSANLGFREGFTVFQCLKMCLFNLPWLSVIDSHHNSSQVVRVFEHEVIHALQHVVSYLMKKGKHYRTP